MRKHIKKILIIEFLVLAAYLVFAAIKCNDEQTRLDIPLEAWKSDHVKFQDGEWYVNPELLETDHMTTFLYGPYVEVPKGDYTVTVCYECDSDQNFQPFVYETNKGYVKSSVMKLDQAADIVSCDFRVTEDIDNFQLTFWYNGEGELSISGISIDRNHNDVKRSVVILFILLMLINLIIYYQMSPPEKRRYLLAILGITLIASLPVFYTGLDGHDLVFHLTRIDGIARELSYGNFPVRMQSVWMAEYGYPVSIYYGDALLYIPAALRLSGFSIDEAYKMFVLMVNLASVLIAEQCFKRIFRKANTVLLLTLVYVTASYRLVDVYVRGAVGEYTALMFLPLIALAAYHIYCDGKNDTPKKQLGNAAILAIGMTGMITAHLLTAEMTAFALLLVCVFYLKKTFCLNTIKTYAAAVLGTLLMSAGFLVPFIDYYLNVQVEITDTLAGAAETIQEKGASLGDFFSFFSDPFGDWSTMLFNPGLVLMAALAGAIVLWSSHKATKEIKKMTALSVIMLAMSTNLFPWDSLAHDFTLFNMLAQVQFPWRFIGIAILFLTLLSGFLLEQTACETYLKISKNALISLCAAAAVGMTCLFIGYYADNLERNVYYDTANIDTWDIMGEEYKRVGTTTSDFDGEIHGEGIEAAEFISRKGCEMDIYCKIGKDGGTVILPVINYKGYEVTDDEGNQYAVTDDAVNKLVSFELPADFEGNIYLRFEEPWYWTTASAVSVITALICCGVRLNTKRKNIRIFNTGKPSAEGKLS